MPPLILMPKVAILLVILAIAAMYFCKHFKIGQKSRVINPVVDDADPWLTYTCTAPLPPFDRVPNPPVAEMLYASPACTTFSRAEEAQKFKCRIVFKGTPKGDPRENDFAEYEEAAKEEFAMLRKSGVLKNLELTDSRGQRATPDVSEESITLRYCGLDSSELLEKQVDNRKGKKKIHT